MQSVETTGLDRALAGLEKALETVREVRGQVLEECGAQLLGAVQERIGGSGRVSGVQAYYVGSGKGYVAVRAKANAKLEGYAAGYVTNALEGGHTQTPGRFVPGIGTKLRRDRAPGKYMYRMTADKDAERLAAESAKRIAEAALEALEGG